MVTKTIDNLLNELNDVQLSKESMNCINGGDWCVGTPTGTVCEKDYGNGVYRWFLNGQCILPHELPGSDRTITKEYRPS